MTLLTPLAVLLSFGGAVPAHGAQGAATLPFQVTSVWDGDTSYPAVVTIEGGDLVAKGGGVTVRLKVEAEPSQGAPAWRISVTPPSATGISLRRAGEGHAVRFLPPNGGQAAPGAGLAPGAEPMVSARIAQSTVNHAFSYLSDALLFPEDDVLFHFSGADVKVYGDSPSAGVRVTFSEFRPTLTVREYKAPPLRDARLPNRIQSLLPEAEDAPAAQTAAAVRAWSGSPPPTEQPAGELRAALGRVGPLRPVLGEALRPVGDPRLSSVPNVLVTHVKPRAGRPYAVVTVLNYGHTPITERFSFGDLGLNPALQYNLFEFWTGGCLGAAAGSLALPVPPGGSRTLIITRHEQRPSVIGDSASLLGPEGGGVVSQWDAASRTLSVSLVKTLDDALSVFVTPYGEGVRFTGPSVSASGGSAIAHSGRGYVRVEVSAPKGREVQFSITFKEVTTPEPPAKPQVVAGAASPWSVHIETERAPDSEVAGWYLFRNDWLIGYTADSLLPDLDVDPGVPYSYTIVAVNFDGQLSSVETFPARTPMPSDLVLTRLPIHEWRLEQGRPLINRMPNGEFARLGGSEAPSLILIGAGAVRYKVSRAFEQLSGTVGIEDSAGDKGDVVFSLLADGEEIWSSGPLKAGERVAFSVEIGDVYFLDLVVRDAGGGEEGDVAVWFNPQLKAKPRQ
ncbi:MAG: NPCBM/NEW2 domain-containing protein [Armatimonadota bacterium]